MLNIHNEHTDNTHFYIYLINNLDQYDKNHNKSISTIIPYHKIKAIKNKFKFTPIKRYVSYMYKNMSYRYELETDNQICMKTYLNDICLSISNTCLIHSCEEVKVPFYMFPSTKNLDAKQEYSLEEYKINNRIHLVIKMNTDGHQSVYIHYRHSKNADIDHCQSLISNLLDDLLEPI